MGSNRTELCKFSDSNKKGKGSREVRIRINMDSSVKVVRDVSVNIFRQKFKEMVSGNNAS